MGGRGEKRVKVNEMFRADWVTGSQFVPGRESYWGLHFRDQRNPLHCSNLENVNLQSPEPHCKSPDLQRIQQPLFFIRTARTYTDL